jgi:hypothetical protein
VSTNTLLNVADTNWCVLVKVITRSVVPPALMVEGANNLPMVGRLGVTVSMSEAVHVPELQAMLVLLTPEGTEIVAVLTTWVCD